MPLMSLGITALTVMQLMRLNAYENLLTTFMKKLSVVVHYMTRQQQWIMRNGLKKMSEYTHNDDVADMIYAKEQEIKLLKEALQRIEAELNRITNEYSRGL